MQDQKRPVAGPGDDPGADCAHEIEDTALDVATGGGLLDADPGAFGVARSYIGETEKNVWKAPAGQEITHDPAFEEWAKRK